MADPLTLYRLKISLDGIKPPIWRELETPDCNLFVLHNIVQEAMGWDDEHLWGFETSQGRFGLQADAFSQIRRADQITLAELVEAGETEFRYEYDYGDGWEHRIKVKPVSASDADQAGAPRCLDGARACPPEDCGGVWGYAELLEMLADPEYPDRAERLEWLGDDFDPEKFDAAAVNEGLKRLWARRDKMVLSDFDDGLDPLIFPTPRAMPTRAVKKEKKKKRKAAAQARKRNRGR